MLESATRPLDIKLLMNTILSILMTLGIMHDP